MQEAYNVPSFAGKRRGSRSMAPLQQQAEYGLRGASAEAYDPFVGEDGRGELAAYSQPKSKQDGGNQKEVREGFMCGSMGDSTKGSKAISFDAAGANTSTYSAQAQDYDYYCKNFNICPTPKIQVKEGFEMQPAKGTPKPHAQCQPLNAPMYEIPVSDAAKKQYAKAMEVSMGEGSATQSAPTPMRNVDMSGVTGFYDDEIDQYMNTKDMVAATTPSMPTPAKSNIAPAEPYDPSEATPFTQAMAQFRKNGGRPIMHYEASNTPAPPTDKWQYIMDLALFISAGILIILLCEQLFKIAAAVGMRDTIQLLQPYLAEIAQLKEQLSLIKTVSA